MVPSNGRVELKFVQIVSLVTFFNDLVNPLSNLTVLFSKLVCQFLIRTRLTADGKSHDGTIPSTKDGLTSSFLILSIYTSSLSYFSILVSYFSLETFDYVGIIEQLQ